MNYFDTFFPIARELKLLIKEKGISLSLLKHALDLMKEICLLECKPAETPTLLGQKYFPTMKSKHIDPTKYMVGKLIYLIIRRPNISYLMGIISQFMQELKLCN